MAQYKETVYASDSWAENYVNGDLSGVTRAAVLSSQENFSFTYENMPYFLYAASESWIRVRYPTTSQYQKKRLVRAQQYVYVTGTSSSSSGNIKSGRFVFGYGDFIGDLFDVGVIDSQMTELGDLPKNQYAPIGDDAKRMGRLHGEFVYGEPVHGQGEHEHSVAYGGEPALCGSDLRGRHAGSRSMHAQVWLCK